MGQQDKQGRNLVPRQDSDLDVFQIETDLPNDSSYIAPMLNGRQGDASRQQLTQLMSHGFPTNLTGCTVSIEAKDADGVVKIVNGSNQITAPTAGQFMLTMPATMYQAAGEYQEFWLTVRKDDQVISSTNLHVEVFVNNVILTAGASQTYISGIEDAINESKTLIQNLINGDIKDASIAAAAAKQVAQDTLTAIKNGDMAGLHKANTFTEKQTFGEITADSIALSDGTRPLYPKDFNPLGKVGFQPLPGTLLSGWTQATYTFGYWFAMINPETKEGLLKFEGTASYNADIQPYSSVDMFGLDSNFPFTIQDAWELGTGNNFLSGFGQGGWMAFFQNKISVHSREQMIPKGTAIPLSLELHAIFTGGK